MLSHYNGFVQVNGEDIRVLKLNNTIIRVALVHECSNDCHLQNGVIVHSGSILSGEKYKVLLRSSGYPPHTG